MLAIDLPRVGQVPNVPFETLLCEPILIVRRVVIENLQLQLPTNTPKMTEYQQQQQQEQTRRLNSIDFTLVGISALIARLPPIEIKNLSILTPFREQEFPDIVSSGHFRAVSITAVDFADLPPGRAPPGGEMPQADIDMYTGQVPERAELQMDGVELLGLSTTEGGNGADIYATSYADVLCQKLDDKDTGKKSLQWNSLTVTLGSNRDSNNNNNNNHGRKRDFSVAPPARTMLVQCPRHLLRTPSRSPSLSRQTRSDGNFTASQHPSASQSKTAFDTSLPKIGMDAEAAAAMQTTMGVFGGLASLAAMSASAALSASRGEATLRLLRCSIEHKYDTVAVREEGGNNNNNNNNFTMRGVQAVRLWTHGSSKTTYTFYVSFFPGLGIGKGASAAGFFARGALLSHILVFLLCIVVPSLCAGTVFRGKWQDLQQAVLKERQHALTPQQRQLEEEKIHDGASAWSFSPLPKAGILFLAVTCSNLCSIVVVLVYISRNVVAGSSAGGGGDAVFGLLTLVFFVFFVAGCVWHLYHQVFGAALQLKDVPGTTELAIYFPPGAYSEQQKRIQRFLQSSSSSSRGYDVSNNSNSSSKKKKNWMRENKKKPKEKTMNWARFLFLGDQTWDTMSEEWSFTFPELTTSGRNNGLFAKPPGVCSTFGTQLTNLHGPALVAQQAAAVRKSKGLLAPNSGRASTNNNNNNNNSGRGARRRSANTGDDDDDNNDYDASADDNRPSPSRVTLFEMSARIAGQTASSSRFAEHLLDDVQLIPAPAATTQSRNRERSSPVFSASASASRQDHHDRQHSSLPDDKRHHATRKRHCDGIQRERSREHHPIPPDSGRHDEAEALRQRQHGREREQENRGDEGQRSATAITLLRQRLSPFSVIVELFSTFVIALLAGIGNVERGSCYDLLVAVVVVDALTCVFILWLRADRVPRRLIESAMSAILLLIQALIVAIIIGSGMHLSADRQNSKLGAAVTAAQVIVGVGLTVVSGVSMMFSVVFRILMIVSKCRVVSVSSLRRMVRAQMRDLPQHIVKLKGDESGLQ